MLIAITYIVEVSLGFAKRNPKIAGVFVVGLLCSAVGFYLFKRVDPTHAGAQISAKEVREAKKEIVKLNAENTARLDTITNLKKQLASDTVRIAVLKENLGKTQIIVQRQKEYIKIIDSKYEKVNAIDDATDAELYERLSNTSIHTKAHSN